MSSSRVIRQRGPGASCPVGEACSQLLPWRDPTLEGPLPGVWGWCTRARRGWGTASWGPAFPDRAPGGTALAPWLPLLVTALSRRRAGGGSGRATGAGRRSVGVIAGMAAFTPSQHTAAGGLMRVLPRLQHRWDRAGQVQGLGRCGGAGRGRWPEVARAGAVLHVRQREFARRPQMKNTLFCCCCCIQGLVPCSPVTPC